MVSSSRVQRNPLKLLVQCTSRLLCGMSHGPPGNLCYRRSADLALRYVALIIQNMFSIFPRNQAKKAYGKKKSIRLFIPVETNYLAPHCGLAANCLLFPGCHLACMLWLTAGEKGCGGNQ